MTFGFRVSQTIPASDKIANICDKSNTTASIILWEKGGGGGRNKYRDLITIFMRVWMKMKRDGYLSNIQRLMEC